MLTSGKRCRGRVVLLDQGHQIGAVVIAQHVHEVQVSVCLASQTVKVDLHAGSLGIGDLGPVHQAELRGDLAIGIGLIGLGHGQVDPGLDAGLAVANAGRRRVQHHHVNNRARVGHRRCVRLSQPLWRNRDRLSLRHGIAGLNLFDDVDAAAGIADLVQHARQAHRARHRLSVESQCHLAIGNVFDRALPNDTIRARDRASRSHRHVGGIVEEVEGQALRLRCNDLAKIHGDKARAIVVAAAGGMPSGCAAGANRGGAVCSPCASVTRVDDDMGKAASETVKANRKMGKILRCSSD